MDLGTSLGLFLGFGLVVLGIVQSGKLTDFIDIPGALIVFGGAFASLFIMFPMHRVLGIFGIVKNCFFTKVPDPLTETKRLAELAAMSRRDGLLALEKQVPEIKDAFLVRGLEMVIEGTPREKLEEVLQTELGCIQERHAVGKRMFEQLGASLPAFGMVGTLIGLIQMLGSLDDPSQIGKGMAVAMITTFYGALGANMAFLPMAGKLESRSKEETLVRELMIQGLSALSEGESPRTIETRLHVFLAPKKRPTENSAA